MKSGKSQIRSQSTLKSSSHVQVSQETSFPSLDVLKVNIKSLKFANADRRPHTISASFFDQLLFSETITPIGLNDEDYDEGPYYNFIAGGTMSFDPSDYAKMCLFADNPLIIRLQPTDKLEAMPSISCCNVDILPLFQGEPNICILKRMEPMIEPTSLEIQSWENLPLVRMEIRVTRDPTNQDHHKILSAANILRATVIGAYNVIMPYDDTFEYIIATKLGLSNGENSEIRLYKNSKPCLRKFPINGFYPKWETIKDGDEFLKCSEKLTFYQDDLQNNNNININHYLNMENQNNNVIWGSFHRTLVLTPEEPALKNYVRHYEWPVEFHINDIEGGYSFMGFLNLFKLLYPGETKVRLAVPLQWMNPLLMMERCGCDPLLTPHNKIPISTIPHMNSHETLPHMSNKKDRSPPTASVIMDITQLPTGADGTTAFLILEIQLARPLVKAIIPPLISEHEIKRMLHWKKKDDEKKVADDKPRCTGRGQLNKEWHNTVKMAAYSLRKVPYFGTTEFCAFSRQLSEMRVRTELATSIWQDAAVYINNNFVVQNFVDSDDTFEELIMMAHPCLMREATAVLIGEQEEQNLTLRAARHARQLQDIPHATELYLQLVAENQNNANSWRELATCLMDENIDFAQVCIDKAVLLDPRQPLTLLSKGCMLYEKDPDSAEMFFMAMLALYPLWTTGWVVAEAFYLERQEFYVAKEIRKFVHHNRSTGLTEDLAPERGWEKELGDWWYPTPLRPGMSLFFDATDLLLRIRGLPLAEVCLGRAFFEHGAAPAHAHLVALACRLRGDFSNALCHLQKAIDFFGEVNYLRSLEAECLDKLNDRNAALSSFEKSGTCVNAYSILSLLPCPDAQRTRGVVLEVLRTKPSAYAWMALADDWLMRLAAREKPAGAGDADAEVTMSACAAACAEQALKCDRRCARAWALLAVYTKPQSRREYCKRMAIAFGYNWSDELEVTGSEHSLCFRLSKALKDCDCKIHKEWNKLKTDLLDCECIKMKI